MSNPNTRKRRHYIIVVHGIGEQKLNQTAAEVVHRFAEVRRQNRQPGARPRKYGMLLPADLSAQSVRRRGAGHGWSEFKGIPVDCKDDTGEFDGTPATDTSGRNFRFVDLHWQHILQRHQQLYASPAEEWGPAVLERIDGENGFAPEGWMPEWATPLIRSVVDTAIPAKRLLSFRNRELTKLMFDDFLGDVHLYGDYVRTRGRAVRHFHVILDEIHLRDFINWSVYEKTRGDPYEPPVYTVFAHSLGSIMAFDALVYAHASKDIRTGRESAYHTSPSLPFPGYTEPAEPERQTWMGLITRLRNEGDADHELHSEYLSITERYRDNGGFPPIPPLMWRDCVKNFITVGSPIDKYHVIWFQNYLHMGLRRQDDARAEGYRTFAPFKEAWAKGWLDEPEREGTVAHYNLCDEQDPVGHHLEVAQACVNYGRVFDTTIPVAYRDVVFRRYAVPGLAHVKYWEDSDLFKGIVNGVIDGAETEGADLNLTEYEQKRNLEGSYFLRPEFHNRAGVYGKTLEWAYFRLPFFASLLTGGLLSYGFLGLLGSEFAISFPAAIAASILLWTCPRPMEVYTQEAKPQEEQFERKGVSLRRWRPRRSILAHLVAGMVEWRRVLLLLSAGQSTDRQECLQKNLRLAFRKQKKRTGQFWKSFWIRFAAGAVVLVVSAALLAYSCSGEAAGTGRAVRNAGLLGMIFSSSYLAIMIYVQQLYKKAVKSWEERAG